MTSIIERRDLGRDLSPFKSFSNSHLTPPPPSSSPIALTDEVDNKDYRFEAVRLQSFKEWPLLYMKPEKLAIAGFYYTGEADKVRCFECQKELCEWVEGDNPMTEHQRWSPRCRFIRKIPCGNVPIGVDPETLPPARPRSQDICGPYGVEYRPNSGPDSAVLHSEIKLPSTEKLGCLGLGLPKGPAFPDYASYEARLRTFESWPKSMPQTKENLADAGFYYTGRGDRTVCYHCGGGLMHWEPSDNPWVEHTKFPKCYYLLMVKGQDYVNKITGQRVPLPSKEETLRMNLPSFIKKVDKSLAVERSANEHKLESTPSTSRGSQENGLEIVGSDANAREENIENLSNVKLQNSKPVDDARMCKICYNGELGVVFLPCGHMVACVKCAPDMTLCAVCRKPVTLTVRAFFS